MITKMGCALSKYAEANEEGLLLLQNLFEKRYRDNQWAKNNGKRGNYAFKLDRPIEIGTLPDATYKAVVNAHPGTNMRNKVILTNDALAHLYTGHIDNKDRQAKFKARNSPLTTFTPLSLRMHLKDILDDEGALHRLSRANDKSDKLHDMIWMPQNDKNKKVRLAIMSTKSGTPSIFSAYSSDYSDFENMLKNRVVDPIK